MLHRRYPDGIVLFDPTDGITYTIPGHATEIIDLIAGYIAEGTTDPDRILSRALHELGSDAPDGSGDAPAVDNLKRWIQLALHMQQA